MTRSVRPECWTLITFRLGNRGAVVTAVSPEAYHGRTPDEYGPLSSSETGRWVHMVRGEEQDQSPCILRSALGSSLQRLSLVLQLHAISSEKR